MENHIFIKKIVFKSFCNHGRERKKERKGETVERTHRQTDRQ